MLYEYYVQSYKLLVIVLEWSYLQQNAKRTRGNRIRVDFVDYCATTVQV